MSPLPGGENNIKSKAVQCDSREFCGAMAPHLNSFSLQALFWIQPVELIYALTYPLKPHFTFGLVAPPFRQAFTARISDSVADRRPSETPTTQLGPRRPTAIEP